MDYEFDYGIIGGGPAGYTSAISLAKLGKKVILFEKNEIGGTCLNRGCIPTKALLHFSEVYKRTMNASDIGLKIDINNFDFSVIDEKKDTIVNKLRKSLELAVKNSGVNIVYAKANIKNKHTITAENKEYSTENIIFAAGSVPKELEVLKFDHKFILNSDDILKLKKLPKSVLIVGSGAIGIEWSRIFSNFGVDVFLIEYAEHLIPAADIDISKRIERIFKQNKINFYLMDCVQSFDGKIVKLKSGIVIEPELVLVATGRKPVVPSSNDITILGDSCGEIQLAHYAIHQALSYVEGKTFNKSFVPYIIYGEPEIAWIGKREQDCPDTCRSVTLPITALGKSWCDESTEGFIKIITENNLIVGAHIMSKEASSLIHELLIAMQNKLTVDDLMKVCYAHPTYSEGIYESLCRL